jgi:co-chaperonin GroES (HSP10)
MLIKSINSTVLDKAVSTSGKYTSFLVSNSSTLYILVIKDTKLCKVVEISNKRAWEDWKASLQSPAQEEEPTMAEEIGRLLPRLPHEPVLKTRPRGARIFVRPIQPVDEVTARAEAAGIIPVVDERHKPRPTTGIVVAIGEDPLAQELYHLGDIVVYGAYAGDVIMEDGQEYRALGLHEIIGVRSS